MIIKPLQELREVDDRVLRFTPWGLGVGVQMRPEDAADFQQRTVAGLNLDPSVAEGIRQSFEDLRAIFVRGVFSYETYTTVSDQALLMIEQALRDRFVDFHQGTVTFVDKSNVENPVPASRYDQVHKLLGARRRRHQPVWRLRLPDGSTMDFAGGMLSDLWKWARKAGLVRGQRARHMEQALSGSRNLVAHRSSYHLTTPVHATRRLRTLAEIINQLWGVPTPGGRLYPAPMRRDVIAMAWPTTGEEMVSLLATDAFAEFVDPQDRAWKCIILRAVFNPDEHFSDPELGHYDSRFEVTHYTTDLLWGPGTITDAAAWFTQHQPAADQSDHLDRVFMIRRHGNDLYLPMLPSVASALPVQERSGIWYTVKADYPHDARSHVGSLLTSGPCQPKGSCKACPAETLGSGPWQKALAAAGHQGKTMPPSNDVTTPFAFPRSRPIT